MKNLSCFNGKNQWRKIDTLCKKNWEMGELEWVLWDIKSWLDWSLDKSKTLRKGHEMVNDRMLSLMCLCLMDL